MSSSLFTIIELLDWIESHKITKIGNGWAMLCPFHEEKTPSCYIDKHIFRCFSCQAHGDPSNLIVEMAHNQDEMLKITTATERELKALKEI